MRIEIDREWFDKNKEAFAKEGDESLANEDKKYYVITDDVDEQKVITSEFAYDIESINEDNEIDASLSNKTIWIGLEPLPVDSDNIETLVKQGGIDTVTKVMGVVIEKMEIIKGLLNNAKDLK